MLLDRSQIERWAESFPAQGDFPQLIQRLVYASTPGLVKCNIPFGSAVNMGGVDGDVESSQASAYIPKGRCIMEFGTNKSFKTKAEGDYNTRSNNEYEGLNKSETTFIFMTPHCWGNKKDWEDAKKKDGIWKDVRVYDSTMLIQWIISVPPVDIWYSQLIGMQSSNLVAGSDRLKELLEWQDIALDASFYTAGREEIALQLMELIKKPTIRAYRASSKEEAMGFILAAGMLFPENEQKEYYSKTIVVDDKSAFRQMGMQKSVINLVPEFEDTSVLYQAVAHGKIVLVPLGPGDDFNQEVIELPTPDRFGLEEALKKSGIEEEKARSIIKDCSCNLTMIKKTLNFPIFRVDWLNNDDVKEILPALIVERWNENYDGDKEVMASLSGKAYSDFQSLISLWSQKPVPPVMNVGTMWRITSPLSLWSDLSFAITNEHIETLKTVSVQVLTDDCEKYSYQLKHGLLNSLIILAWHGKQFFGNAKSYQQLVDEIIEEIIKDADDKRWNDIAKHLVLLAEASPSMFLNEIKRSLSASEPPIMGLFNEQEGIIVPESKHPYLLWALESLAWLPEYLMPVSEILLKLSEKDPGGRLSNRPFNSLVEFFLPWYPHTAASFDERKAVLDKLSRDGYVKFWELLIELLPKHHGVSSNTHRLKWRGYDLNTQKGVSRKDWWFMIQTICDLLMATYDGTDHQLAALIEKIESLPQPLRKNMILWIKDNVVNMHDYAPKTKKALRETLWYQNRLKPDHDLIMEPDEINAVKEAYEAIVPSDLVDKNKWLFDDFSPRLPEGKDDNDLYENVREIERVRDDAVKEWLDNLSVEEVLDVREKVSEPYEYGRTLGHFCETEGLNTKVMRLLTPKEDNKFINGYIKGIESKKGELDTLQFLDGIRSALTDEEIVAFLLNMWPSEALFNYLGKLPDKMQADYWIKYKGGTFGPYSDTTLYVLNKLRSAGRSLDALNGSWHYAKELPTEILQDLLTECLSCSLDINSGIDIHALESYMEELHERPDADEKKLFQLEWLFVPLIRHHTSKPIVRLLFEKLQNEPELFVELLTFLYRPEHEKDAEEAENVSEEETNIKKNNALRAFYLLREWDSIPGVDKSGIIQPKVLREWVERAIKIGKERDREKFVYFQVGELFAKYPEFKDNPHWPPYEIFALMEDLDSDDLFHNYNIAMFNKRGMTSRGGYEGGDIERGNAEYFDDLKKKCLPLYPHVAKVFEDLSAQYVGMAKKMDDEATIAKLDY